jgi:beta-1,4-N-acetylglucosaminyltransferase
MSRSVFVTVGTTSFHGLVETVLSARLKSALHRKGFTSIVIQAGGYDGPDTDKDETISVLRYRYKPSLAEDIAAASLVISHAGAGTCLEVLKSRKPLIVVVNDTLMNNHQTELAEKLAENKHLVHCVCSTLEETIDNFDESKLRPLPDGNLQAFASFIEDLVNIQ